MGCIACGGGIGGSWEQFNALTRPSMGDIFEEAQSSYEEDAMPMGMFMGY
tara:strand:- start:668 stop:817 length:150 start_codon:yes stop_codon:yes gene_type:complete